jgi:hypothetical protein
MHSGIFFLQSAPDESKKKATPQEVAFECKFSGLIHRNFQCEASQLVHQYIE